MGWSPATALGIDAREAWALSIDSIAKRNRYPPIDFMGLLTVASWDLNNRTILCGITCCRITSYGITFHEIISCKISSYRIPW